MILLPTNTQTTTENDRGCRMNPRSTIMTKLVLRSNPHCPCPNSCATNDARQMRMTDKNTPHFTFLSRSSLTPPSKQALVASIFPWFQRSSTSGHPHMSVSVDMLADVHMISVRCFSELDIVQGGDPATRTGCSRWITSVKILSSLRRNSSPVAVPHLDRASSRTGLSRTLAANQDLPLWM